MLWLAYRRTRESRYEDWARSFGDLVAPSLCADYTGRGEGAREEGLLLHSAHSVPHGDGVDCATMWGDWFFLRAIAEVTSGPVPLP